MKQFNIGDRVRVIDHEIGGAHAFGDEFVVAYVEVDGDGDVFVGSSNDGEAGWFSYHFELVSAAEPARTFNIGDKVRVVSTDFPVNMPVGKVGTVTALELGHCSVEGYMVEVDGWNFFESELEAYVEVKNDHGHQVGQLVMILNNDYGPFYNIGDILPVQEVLPHGVKLTSPTEGCTLFFLNYEVEGYVTVGSTGVDADGEPIEVRRYKVGDIVQVLHTDWPANLPVGSMFAVQRVFDEVDGVEITIDYNGSELDAYFYASEVALVIPVEDIQLLDATEDGHFELTDDEPVLTATEIKPRLCIVYGDTSIMLDPNNPASRQFADSMLALVYN
jgi:hypothetical protein